MDILDKSVASIRVSFLVYECINYYTPLEKLKLKKEVYTEWKQG